MLLLGKEGIYHTRLFNLLYFIFDITDPTPAPPLKVGEWLTLCSLQEVRMALPAPQGEGQGWGLYLDYV